VMLVLSLCDMCGVGGFVLWLGLSVGRGFDTCVLFTGWV